MPADFESAHPARSVAALLVYAACGAVAGEFLWEVLNGEEVTLSLLGPGFYEWLPHWGIETCACVGWALMAALAWRFHRTGAGPWPALPLLLLSGVMLPWGAALSPYLVILSASGCAGLARLLRRDAPEPRADWSDRAGRRIVLALARLYFAAFAAMSLLQYAAYNVSDTDTTSFDRMLWFTLRGRVLWTGEANFFGDHVQPILLALLPLYWLWPSLNALMLAQTAALASGALAVYALARPRLHVRPACACAAAYLLYPAMQFLNIEAVYNTFRPITFSVPFLLWALALLERKRVGACSVCLLAALLCKEEFGLIVAAFGAYAALKHKRRAWGAAVAAVGLAWFLVSVGWVIPHFRGGRLRYMPHYSHLGATPAEAFKTVALHPVRTLAGVPWDEAVLYLLALLAPLALLPALGWEMLLIAAPAFGYSLLSNRPDQRTIHFHYQAPIVPFCAAAAVWGCGRLVDWLARRRPAGAARAAAGRMLLTAALTSAVLLSKSPLSLAFWNPRSSQSFRLYLPGPRARTVRRAGRLVPADASLEASNFASAHFTHRERLYRYPAPDAGAEYVLVDLNEPWLRDRRGKVEADLRQRVLSGRYAPIFNEAGVVLLRRKSARR